MGHPDPPALRPEVITGLGPLTRKLLRRRADNSLSKKGKMFVQLISMFSAELEQINRHRRNHSQHNLTLADIISTPDHTVVEKEGYLLKAKIADGGKKLRKNWSTSWIVLTSRKMEFYKESKQPALANLKPGYKPECVDLCGARIEWTPEKSSRKNVFQVRSNACISLLI
ncbi:rho GTPase-activating protein 15 [Meleagris gallopavo]|uniref:rho GTPase-activating protein 15 n=1 Tax=Meleagris gallopavo TaxID=9103 RepID=UPI0012AB54A0|nr:rho GTPase-activating protein 15 [Meleagris gallopavo]